MKRRKAVSSKKTKKKKKGYVGTKFKSCMRVSCRPPRNTPKLQRLMQWCRTFDKMGIAPPYPLKGGSFGNMSFRQRNGIVITASSTGLGTIKPNEFCLVHSADIKTNSLSFSGIKQKTPSSEAPLHFAIYQRRPDVNVVFHGHDPLVMKHAKELGLVETKKEWPYGTPEFFSEVLSALGKNNFFVWKNHGICSMGATMKEAGNLAVEMHKKALALEKKK